MRISAFNRSCERKQSRIYPSRSLKKVAISFDHDPILFSAANPADEVFGRYRVRWGGGFVLGTAVAAWLAGSKPDSQRPLMMGLATAFTLVTLALLYSNVVGDYRGVQLLSWLQILVNGVLAAVTWWLTSKFAA